LKKLFLNSKSEIFNLEFSRKLQKWKAHFAFVLTEKR